jgi:translation initiation factor IF-2
MAKIRVYELARDLGIESKALVTKAKTLGISVASHQSTLSSADVESLKSNLGKAGATAVAKSPTVIRRRRKVVEPTVPTEIEGDSEGVTEADAAVFNVEVQPEAVFEVPPEEDAADSEKAEITTLKLAEESVSEEDKSVESPGDARKDEPPVKLRVAEPDPESIPEEKVIATEAAEETQKPAKKVAKKSDEGAGATIVRRATQEEIESIESQSRRKTVRKEDHRGTRVTGLGLLSNRVSAEEAETDEPRRSENRWEERKTDKPRVDSEEEEKRLAQLRLKNKARRENIALTTRALLSKVDTEDDQAVKGRTVYTPTATSRKRDLKRRKDLKKTLITTPRAAYRVVTMSEAITVGELAKQLSIKAAEIIKKLMAQGVMATINQELDEDTATLIANEYHFEVRNSVLGVEDILKLPEIPSEQLQPRAPIVTVMGHVDHGKTSILDAIKETDEVAKEAGGITQHIGAYAVNHNGHKITFLDTPGHEAFSSMRARGAKVTDIVVLVIAADDGVMPQTIEAINHAKDAGVPLIVAINKIDKANTNLDRVFTELTEHGVQSEEWGGDTQFVKCSALQKTGIEDLLEAVLLQSEVLELKATSEGTALGTVIEAHLDIGRGPVATIVVQRGTLSVGDFVVCGSQIGRVRGMQNHMGQEQAKAGPSDPVEVIGLSGVPQAGDQVNAVLDERTAREAADFRQAQATRDVDGKSSAASLDDLLAKVQTEEIPEVPFLLKADTQGSVEAVSESIQKLSTAKVKNRIVHAAVGGISESDISLAQASGGIIIGFNVRAQRGLDEIAEKSGVPIQYFSIIYDIVDSVKSIMLGKLPPVYDEVFQGRAEVRKPISVPKVGTVAGSAVTDGKITRNAHCRLIRDSIVVYEGKLSSLRRFKDDVKEVQTGYECGISIDGYNDIKIGDVIEAFIFEEQAASLT